jgi:hypothetical protein
MVIAVKRTTDPIEVNVVAGRRQTECLQTSSTSDLRSQIHGAEPLFRNSQSPSYSRHLPDCVEFHCSLLTIALLSLAPMFIQIHLLRLGLPSLLFPSGFPTKILYGLHFAPMRATCPAHLFGLIRLIIFGERHQL